MIFSANGKDYRVFRVESIHEVDTFVECRNASSNELQCEIRIDADRRAHVMPSSIEIDLAIFPALVEYVNGL